MWCQGRWRIGKSNGDIYGIRRERRQSQGPLENPTPHSPTRQTPAPLWVEVPANLSTRNRTQCSHTKQCCRGTTDFYTEKHRAVSAHRGPLSTATSIIMIMTMITIITL